MKQNDLQAKFLGCMIGSALGDAIGELAFRCQGRRELHGAVERSDCLIYTDDTAMAIGVAESLIAEGRIVSDRLGDTFRRNYESEPWRGYAAGPPTIFALCREGKLSYANVARRLFGGTGSYGNGAAMRIAPIGLFYYDSDDIRAPAEQSAHVTHTHPVGVDGAVILAAAVAFVVGLEPGEELCAEELLARIGDIADTPQFAGKIALMEDLWADRADAATAAEELGTDITAHGSVPFAIYSFLMNPRWFEECLYHAVLVPGDRDTIGAMACAISGAFLGIDGIPEIWASKLENRGYIRTLAEDLAAARG